MIIHSPRDCHSDRLWKKNNSKTMADSIVNSQVPVMPWHSETITSKTQSAVPQNQGHDISQAVTPGRLTMEWSSGHPHLPWLHRTLQITYCNQSSPKAFKIHESRSRRNWILKYGFPQRRTVRVRRNLRFDARYWATQIVIAITFAH